jgi:hypothetical protein
MVNPPRPRGLLDTVCFEGITGRIILYVLKDMFGNKSYFDWKHEFDVGMWFGKGKVWQRQPRHVKGATSRFLNLQISFNHSPSSNACYPLHSRPSRLDARDSPIIECDVAFHPVESSDVF